MSGLTGNRNVTRKHKWALDFNVRSKGDHANLPNPVGYSPTLGQVHSEISKDADKNLLMKKSWDIALGPLKQVPMNLFIMYMAGNSISIFPIMMVVMALVRPIKALLQIQSTFKIIEGEQAITQKIVYIIGNFVGVGLALYKSSSMGLLPTHTSDWLTFVEPQHRAEFADGGINL
ncbi:ER membrane protein complex subunit 4 [Nymphon striatum]|nr:ER membrane protein complex subunit 4 [Nymphon striatum]